MVGSKLLLRHETSGRGFRGYQPRQYYGDSPKGRSHLCASLRSSSRGSESQFICSHCVSNKAVMAKGVRLKELYIGGIAYLCKARLKNKAISVLEYFVLLK